MMTYEFKTIPLRHQLEVWNASKDLLAYGLLHEQGCGKSKILIDSIGHLFLQKKIDAAIVIAPNNVHRNWETDELPKHLPDAIQEHSKIVCWHTKRANTVGQKNEMEALLKYPGLSILLMSYDSVRTEAGAAFISRFLVRRKCFFAADESHRIKTPGALRTKRVCSLAKKAPYRRIATGTPIANSPFDIYSQVLFLDETFWHRRGIANFQAFKNHFGRWQRKLNHNTNQMYDDFIEYKNLDELGKILQQIGSRLLKEDVLDLPPKVYTKRYHEMLPEQKHLYEKLRDETYVQLKDGSEITATLALTCLLRLQQIVCGYVPVDGETPTRLLTPSNPRLDLLLDQVEDLTCQGIIWARFTQDIDQICNALGKRAVRYDGKVSSDEAQRNKNAFRAGDAQWFVGNTQKGGEGITLTEAEEVFYYSNSFSLTQRLQSEDRAHRIGQTKTVRYTDLICEGTVDEGIVESLRSNFDIASQVNGDRLREWI